MRQYTGTVAKLMQELEKLEVVDAHEHLPPERVRLSEHFDAFTLFRQYTRLVMFSAGLDEPTFMRMHDPEVPLDERFEIFDKYRDFIRLSGAARAAYIAMDKFYGEKELTRESFDRITAKMQDLYRPGLYHKVLRETCGIRLALVNYPDMDYDDPLLKPVPEIGVCGGSFSALAERIIHGEHGFNSVDEYVDELTQRLSELKEKGAVAVKARSDLYCEPNAQEAAEVFHKLRTGDTRCAELNVPNPLLNYVYDRLLTAAGELDLPVAVHTGVWNDYRLLDPKEMIPRIMRHPDVKFDLFHMGIPFVRDMGRIGANFGNVWLNMCWAHTVSPEMAASALNEWLDQVATNKITAFGGDVRWPVEKIYGHLVLAREVVATVLARRLDLGDMTWEHALFVAGRLFRDNPAELYRVL